MQDRLQRFFGTPDLAKVDPMAVPAGGDRMFVDFRLERDRWRRLVPCSLLSMLGAAPELDVAFQKSADRETARNMMDIIAIA